jgi:hypothetical protein
VGEERRQMERAEVRERRQMIKEMREKSDNDYQRKVNERKG